MADTLTAQELKDLDDLIASPGWKVLEIMVDREWGAAGFGAKIANTIGSLDQAQVMLAVAQLQQATVTQREVLRIMHWPKAQLSQAKTLALGRVASMNRGGL
jgi:hypothetical protein